MISPAIQAPIVRPFYNRSGGAAPETIGQRLNYQASSIVGTANLSIPNVVAQTGDVLVVGVSHEAGAGQAVIDVTWGAATLNSLYATTYGNTIDHSGVIATVDGVVGGTHTLHIILSGATPGIAAVVTPWYGLLDGTIDQRSQNQVPPDLAVNDGDSGLTPITTQAHELILGLYASIIQLELNGAFALPLVLYNDKATGSALHPDSVKAGAAIVHATGQYRSDYVGHTLADWAALCVTLKGA